jgi:ADP-heptose:LPS heptosyltransferase
LKIAVIRFSSLGDVILSSAVLQPLYEAGHEITFITFKPFDQLFIKDYRIKNLIALDKTQLKSINQIKNFAKSLKNQDLILDLHSNLRSFLISKFSSKKTLRYDKKSIKRRLFTKPFIKNFINLKDFNVLDVYLQPLKKIGIKNLENYRPRIIIDEEDSINIPLPEDFIVISTGARYKGKIYPYFKEVIEKINENVVLIGSKEDKEKDKNVYKNVLDLRGKLNLRQSLYVISKAKFTISNDSAVAHMSRAVGTPVLVIYGATHPYFGFAPKKDEGSYIFAGLKCQPCDLHGKKECKYKDYRCFKEIKPELIIKEYKNLKK